MAIYPIVKGVPRYIGLSTDTKPTVAAPQGLEAPLIGSTFLEYNTGSLFITHDATTWVLKDAIGEVQASPTSNTLLDRLKALLTGIVLAAGTAAIGKLAANSGVDIGDVDVTSVIDTLITKLRHPFGKGSLTTNGVQYCTPVTGITNAAYVAIETITIQQPPGMTLEEIEFGLTGAVGASGATDAKLWKWQASDAGTDWQDLIAEQSHAALAAYTDVTISGRFAPTGNFLGTGSSFQVRMVMKSAGATDTVNGKTKNSSYVVTRYRRT